MTDQERDKQFIRDICWEAHFGGCSLRDYEKRKCTAKDDCEFVDKYARQIADLPYPIDEGLLLTPEQIKKLIAFGDDIPEGASYNNKSFPLFRFIAKNQLTKDINHFQPIIDQQAERIKELEAELANVNMGLTDALDKISRDCP